jgi:hypothetical protein
LNRQVWQAGFLFGFRKALLREGIENFLSGDVETGKIILRDFINATVGFTKLSDVTHRSAKSLMRMLGPRGNPQARNLFEIVASGYLEFDTYRIVSCT